MTHSPVSLPVQPRPWPDRVPLRPWWSRRPRVGEERGWDAWRDQCDGPFAPESDVILAWGLTPGRPWPGTYRLHGVRESFARALWKNHDRPWTRWWVSEVWTGTGWRTTHVVEPYWDTEQRGPWEQGLPSVWKDATGGWASPVWRRDTAARGRHPLAVGGAMAAALNLVHWYEPAAWLAQIDRFFGEAPREGWRPPLPPEGPVTPLAPELDAASLVARLVEAATPDQRAMLQQAVRIDRRRLAQWLKHRDRRVREIGLLLSTA